MKIGTTKVYFWVLTAGFCIPIAFAAMAEYGFTRFIPTNSSLEGIFALTFFGLWPSVIMFQDSINFFTRHGFPLLLFSDLVNMTLYVCVCGGIYVSRKIKTSEVRPFVILASYGVGVFAAGGLALLMMLMGI